MPYLKNPTVSLWAMRFWRGVALYVVHQKQG